MVRACRAIGSAVTFYYLRARYYDPATTQFVTRDPALASTLSPYRYVHDNPLNSTNPSGRCGSWGSDTCWGHSAVSLATRAIGLPALGEGTHNRVRHGEGRWRNGLD